MGMLANKAIFRRICGACLFLLTFCEGASALAEVEQGWDPDSLAAGEALFAANCAACHSLDSDGIGPPLGGIGQIADRSKLAAYIRDPKGVLEAGDLRANALLARYKLVMPDFAALSDAQIASLLDYIDERSTALGLSPFSVDLTRSFKNGDRVVAPVQPSGLAFELEDFANIPLATDRTSVKGIATLRAHPSGDGRLWIGDQMGVIYSLKDGEAEPILDLRSLTEAFIFTPGIGTGLGSFAFHPGYLENGLLYTTHAEGYAGLPAINDGDFPDSIEVPLQWVLTEWTLAESAGDVEIRERRELLRLNTPTTAHGAQDIGFAPVRDQANLEYGKLYIGIGDGGANNIRMPELCHTIRSLLGTIIRIDPLGTNGRSGEYGIPSDNPFAEVEDPTVKREIWAYGFRNPHRMCWDDEYGLRMLVADIGESNVEEVNVVVKGGDYGWSSMEGDFMIQPTIDLKIVHEIEGTLDPSSRSPWGAYDHMDGRAISGGFVYRGPIEALRGKYVFGDIVLGRIFYMNVDAELSDSTVYEVALFTDGVETSIQELSSQKRTNLRIGYDELAGDLYFMTKADGAIRRVVNVYRKDGDSVWRPAE